MTRPRVSVIVLTYERKRLLGDCLRSLLAQTYPSGALEIIVSDDGSRDGTRELVGRMQASHGCIKYVHQPHRGIPAARNNGIRNATGDIVAIVADDYLLDPAYVSTIVDFFEQRPEAQIVRFKMAAAGNDPGSRISHFYFDMSIKRRLQADPLPEAEGWRDRLARAWRRPPPFTETITTDHQLEAAGAAAFRCEVFKAVGSFDESLQRAEDTDMTMRLRALGIKVYYYPFLEFRHRYHPLMFDTLTKCFLTGLNRSRLYQKHEIVSRHRSAARTLVSQEVGAILSALWRARQAGSVPKLLCYLPFMLLFETATGLGFFVGFVSRRPRPTS